jgi:hypothetical protein
MMRVVVVRDTVGPAFESARAVLANLTSAGVRGGEGTPFGPTIDRLIRIHRESTNYQIRSLIMIMLPAQSQQVRSLEYLREVATSPTDRTASWAMTALTDAAEKRLLPGAEAAVRDLWDKKLVTEQVAAATLRAYAASKGWK